MDSTVRLPGQLSKESLSKSTTPKDSTSLELSGLASGGHANIVNAASEALIAMAENTSSTVLSKESKAIIQNFIDDTAKGFVGNAPMICRGPLCPFRTSCPLLLAGSDVPLGKKCPVEATMVKVWVGKHLQALGITDIHDPQNSFDMDMLYELAGQELIRWRCSVHLSDSPSLVSREQVGGTVHGDPIFADVITPVLEILERSGKNINRIREALVATREAQLRAGQIAQDPSKAASDLVEKARSLVKERMRKQAEADIKDVEFEVKDGE